MTALVAGIGLDVSAHEAARQQRSFREQALQADAEVTRLWRGRGENKQPWLAYRFTAQGRAYEQQAKVRLQRWRGLRVGSTVPVSYLPSDPNVSYPWRSGPEALPPYVAYLVAASLALAGGLVLLPLRSQRRLLVFGRAAHARVTRHAKKDEHGTAFDFEFAALSGATVRSKAGPRRSPPPVGGSLCVLYEREAPRRNAPYPLSLVRPARTQSL